MKRRTYKGEYTYFKYYAKKTPIIKREEINMEHIFVLKGLDCPHCSAEIEADVGKISGVSYSSVNLIKQTLIVKTDEEYSGDVFDDVKKIVHGHEPDVDVTEKNGEFKEEKKIKSMSGRIARLSVGAAIYISGLLVNLININMYVSAIILIVSYIILSIDVVMRAAGNILKGRVFDENFLMTVSTVGAFVIGEYPEAVAVMLFYQVGELFQDLAVNRSRKSISELMDIRPDTANVKRDGIVEEVSPETVKKGEIIVVKPGEEIPLDGVVTEGESMLDTTALTGESVPRSIKKGDTVLSGCINQSGVLTVEVTKAFHDSTASKIIDLVENAASRKAPAENFITAFSRYYTPVVVLMALLLAVIPPVLFGGQWTDWIRRGFVFLVISCPCALVISIPLTFFGGIGRASKKGVLVKGSNYLEALNKLDTVVFDKTGTLTKGVFKVNEIITAPGVNEDEVIEYAAKAESFSNHPIADSIRNACPKEFDRENLSEYKEISGQGISVNDNGHTIIAGNEKLMEGFGIEFEQCEEIGTKVYVAADNKYMGCIVISDEIKSDSKEAITELKKLGIKRIVMLTGDDERIAKSVAEKVGIDKYYSQLLPDDKVLKLEQFNSENTGKTAFVGDGINDAPVLARADVGIAMGGLGSDAAIEAADVVLMTDEVSKLVDAVKIAGETKRIVLQNIIFALGIKAVFLILGAVGIAGMWMAVFGDVGVMVIAVLNAMRILKK